MSKRSSRRKRQVVTAARDKRYADFRRAHPCYAAIDDLMYAHFGIQRFSMRRWLQEPETHARLP